MTTNRNFTTFCETNDHFINPNKEFDKDSLNIHEVNEPTVLLSKSSLVLSEIQEQRTQVLIALFKKIFSRYPFNKIKSFQIKKVQRIFQTKIRISPDIELSCCFNPERAEEQPYGYQFQPIRNEDGPNSPILPFIRPEQFPENIVAQKTIQSSYTLNEDIENHAQTSIRAGDGSQNHTSLLVTKTETFSGKLAADITLEDPGESSENVGWSPQIEDDKNHNLIDDMEFVFEEAEEKNDKLIDDLEFDFEEKDRKENNETDQPKTQSKPVRSVLSSPESEKKAQEKDKLEKDNKAYCAEKVLTEHKVVEQESKALEGKGMGDSFENVSDDGEDDVTIL